jgi:hypothetical protein
MQQLHIVGHLITRILDRRPRALDCGRSKPMHRSLLGVVAVLLLSSCASTGTSLDEAPDYRPPTSGGGRSNVSTDQAQGIVKNALLGEILGKRDLTYTTISRVELTPERLQVVTEDTTLRAKRYLGRVKDFWLKDLTLEVRFGGTDHGTTLTLSDAWVIDMRHAPDTAVQLADALNVLKQGATVGAAEIGQRFAAIAKNYREGPTKPEFPEVAREAKVKAEIALKQKHLVDALNYYGEAIHFAPWWPEGHFNRAHLFAELNSYDEAMREMKLYLMLVPDAPDARAAQDQIYAWETGEVAVAAPQGSESGGQANGGCFIATAAYGSALEGHVQVLRDFRDRRLLTNGPGQRLVAFYYRTSPPIADYIRQRAWLRAVVRGVLTPVVYTIEFPLLALGLALTALAGIAGLCGRRIAQVRASTRASP